MFKKHIYFSTVILATEDELTYPIPIEWISPIDTAFNILERIESKFIFKLQPELNIQKKSRYFSDKEDYLIIMDSKGKNRENYSLLDILHIHI